jgi:hypothetical protein
LIVLLQDAPTLFCWLVDIRQSLQVWKISIRNANEMTDKVQHLPIVLSKIVPQPSRTRLLV